MHALSLILASGSLVAASVGSQALAGVLFEDDFNRGFPGWTVVKPSGGYYYDGPLCWQYDIVSSAFVEQSNLYTDSASYSPTTVAPMVINETLTTDTFTFSARLTAGDDDGFGLLFGYVDESNFYRVTFARQSRTAGFPWHGWSVDRKVNGATETLFGAGTPGHVRTFVNTSNRPFDVILSVGASSAFNLTVIDNPAGTPTSYSLVVNRSLPTSPAGRVGVFTWGMSGSVPKGFRIGGLSLSPVPLTGDPNALTRWTPVVPPRANGSTVLISGNTQPLWSLAVGEHGPLGVLVENGDCYAGNDTPGQVDFTGPTLLAGDPRWSDYVVVARITPRDDDAHGLLLRCANPTNFYRVALRSQDSSVGPHRGLSIQKCVNRAYTEIFHETAVRYDPVANVPYDLVASIHGDTLEVLLVSDPEGAANAFAYGPFNIPGATVNTGGIGLFSWAMAQTEFDFVRVQDGTPLHVSSPLGTPNPPRGLNALAPGTLVQATAGEPVLSANTRHFPCGWTGSGSVPASGSGSNVAFTLTTFSRLHWIWRSEHRLVVTQGPGGAVSCPPGEWFAEGSRISVTALPQPGYAFREWQGDALSTASTLELSMNQPCMLKATFTPDSDGDALPDVWELACFGNLAANPGDDPDADGRSNLAEYEAGTNPSVTDVFRIANLHVAGSHCVLTVTNNSGTRYSLERSPNATGPWTSIVSTQFSATVTAPMLAERAFHRLMQPARPPDALPFEPGSWTLAVLPDTQVYSASYPDLFMDQARWIAANRDRRNITYVLQLGDVTNNNLTNQWAVAKDALALLDGQVPYAIAPGNHDYGPSGSTASRTTFLNDYFPPARFVSWPTFGGVKDPGRLDNSYHRFSADGVDWLILALEFGPRHAVVAWANSIIAQHPNHKIILITHAYLYDDNTRYDWATKGTAQSWNPHAYTTAGDAEGTNDGEELWQKLVRQHPNFVMVLSGHVLNDGLGRRTSLGDHGNTVHEMLVNYQMEPMGGQACLRLLEFLPDGITVRVTAYSPFSGTYKTDPQNQFVLTLDPPLH